MKIGIMTFHWAANYGAVLQAFALQEYLRSFGHRVEIVDYVPSVTSFFQRVSWILNRDRIMIRREKNISEFRKEYLNLGKRHFGSNRALRKANWDYDVLIAGSDQILNMSFIEYSERRKRNYSYYLDFTDKCEKIAYAASFGCDSLDERFKPRIAELLNRFSAVSVRENSGKKILDDLSISGQVVMDPTLLLTSDDYTSVFRLSEEKEGLCIYKLRSNQRQFDLISGWLREQKYGGVASVIGERQKVGQWLRSIRSAEFVITNSFHGTVFSILFHKPFICVGMEGSGMDNRLLTLLESTGLGDRFMKNFKAETVDKLYHEKICWEDVDANLRRERRLSEKFLTDCLR